MGGFKIVCFDGPLGYILFIGIALIDLDDIRPPGKVMGGKKRS